jgi:hypothetical protein
MAVRKALRVVAEGATAPQPVRLSVSAAAATGDQLKLLVAMRARIAVAVTDEDCPPRDLAALTRRLQDVAKEISVLELRAREEGSDSEDVAGDEAWSAEAL